MDRTSSRTGDKRDFRDAVGVEVSKTRDRLSNQSANLCILYARRPNYAVLG